jgi:phage baseplate assembly protein W
MINGWTSLADINSASWQPKLGELGDVVTDWDDINQCITIIITTPKGTDFFRPTFGCDWFSYVDWPITAVTPQVVAAIAESLAVWEPRINFQWATVRPYLEVQPDGSNLLIEVQWSLKLSYALIASAASQIQSTLINVALGGILT